MLPLAFLALGSRLGTLVGSRPCVRNQGTQLPAQHGAFDLATVVTLDFQPLANGRDILALAHAGQFKGSFQCGLARIHDIETREPEQLF